MNGLPNVSTYNGISRLVTVKLTWNGEKKNIADDIRAMNPGDRARLLSKLVAIKYYRQTGIGWFNNVEDVNAQNQLWDEIQNEKLLPFSKALGRPTPLRHLMAFIKDDGFLVQSKLPSELKELLLLDDAGNRNVIDNFADKERDKMCEFLTYATGETWQLFRVRVRSTIANPVNHPEPTSYCETPPTSIAISLAGTTSRKWIPSAQTQHDYNSAALCTIAQILGKVIPPDLSKRSVEYETQAEKQTRTSKGFIEVAIQNGLANAKAVTTSSVDEYRRCIEDSLRKETPLIAPFLVDCGLVLTATCTMASYDGLFRGRPITQQKRVTEMGQPLLDLIQKSSSIDEFKKSVAEYKAGRTPIRETQLVVRQFVSILEQMTEGTFNGLKAESMSIDQFIVNNDLAHSCVITGYNPQNDRIAIAHWGQTCQTTAQVLFDSSQLLPEGHKGVLYTFHG